jgi:DHA2 family multidrug resistance protein
MTIAIPRAGAANRSLITVTIVLASILPSIDATIANVALPSMGGSMSATPEQITWVLTSYIVSAAVMTPLTGWLAARFGRKRIFLVATLGFTIASGLCGLAQNLEEIILFRILQGAMGAPLAPLAQVVILDSYDHEERGPAMAAWSMGMMVAPILGPLLGGYLTQTLDWRWVFLINIPIGLVATAGVIAFIPADRKNPATRLDFTGWAMLSIFLITLQLMLDRGHSQDWFQSTEIVVYALVAAMALYMFVAHMLTTDNPFMSGGLFKDRNLMTAMVVMLVCCIEIFSAMALLPLLMQGTLHYTAELAGLVLAPRGVAAFFSSFLAGLLVGKVDNRLLIIIGLGFFAASFWPLTALSPDMDARLIVVSGLLQGMSNGLIFIPLSTMAYATLAPHLRGEATSLYGLARNLGGSIGISIMVAAHATMIQTAREELTPFVRSDNPLMHPTPAYGWYDMADVSGLMALNSEVTRQATIQAYAGVFALLFVMTLAIMPLVLLLRKPKR